jgi:(2Fe-2S) ferredoxin
MTQKNDLTFQKSKSTATKSPPTKAKQTGPNTDSGKYISSMNAVKTGLHVTGWLDDQEQSEYDSLYTSLCKEYCAVKPTLLMQIERMASTMIKMRRLQKIEAALFQKARQIAKTQYAERPLRPEQSSSERELAANIAQIAAMPEMDRLSTLQRYQTSLDRQLSKIVGEIRILSAPYRVLNEETYALSDSSSQKVNSYESKSSSILTHIEGDPLRSDLDE